MRGAASIVRGQELLLARPKQTSTSPAPGAGTVFALRAIGLVLAARWALSMSQLGYLSSLRAIASSPWACVNVVLIFLLIVLPGAKARLERPLHPLPQWLRQALRLLALVTFGFAVFSVGAFIWASGWRRFVHALAETNGWLLVGPALYACVMWICRPRALWRSNIAARRFSIGRYAISLDPVTRTAVVWAESRKLGQYDARELSLKWPEPPAGAAPSATLLAPATEPATASAVQASGEARSGLFARRQKVELLWDSPAAAGHNRTTVFRAPLANDSDRNAARALDATLRQV
jgi:hypothetical protein